MRWLQTTILSAAAAWAVAAATSVDTEGTAARPGCSLHDFRKLASRLSKESEVYLPGSAKFDLFSQRWSNLETPIVNITVLPATENDIVEIVRVANKCNIPFLAYNGVHGSITTLGRMDWGIAINIRKLSSVTIAGNGKTATVGGGTNSKVFIDKLWKAGKQAVTGTCECVSYMGPALGGGHGWLQGYYGLIGDQFVSMNIVLADGTLKTISPKSHPDLWWAMNGAGHNFGIVTSVTVKIYPRKHTNWAIETLLFTGDKVKAVYQAANDHLMGDALPVNLINWSYWFNLPDVSSTPVIEFYILQEGTSVDPAYTKPFHDLGPVSITPKNGTYRDISKWVGISLDSPPCQKTGAANPRFPLYLPSYNATAQEQVYNLFASATTAPSSPFANSLYMLEAYPMQGVRAIPSHSSAFAYRADNLLIAPLLQYTPAGPELDQQAAELGNRMRQILHEGSGRSQMHTYVNYAYGDESPEEWYGHEKWRQERLRELKKRYDPRGRFSFYGPAA